MKEFVIIPVTSCSCEHCFSKLLIVKSKLLAVMKQDRLCHLLLSFIEQELATNVNVNNVTVDFQKIEKEKGRLL